MPYIAYKRTKFQQATLGVIDQANEIIADYAEQGYDLTLRQLYYQFVARDLIPNTQKSYDRLGSIVNKARLSGLIDWDTIVDRTRNLQTIAHWPSVGALLAEDARVYREDKWRLQDTRIEVWVEKEALAGVFERVCGELELPSFACRGYVSQSEMWHAAQRLRQYEREGFFTVILHFGDHDPSGLDMTRDIQDRLRLFRARTEVKRLALNMDQVEKYNPPPNPAKKSDARWKAYAAEYGNSSWELDALNPQILSALVEDAVAEYRVSGSWDLACEQEEDGRSTLQTLSEEHQ